MKKLMELTEEEFNSYASEIKNLTRDGKKQEREFQLKKLIDNVSQLIKKSQTEAENLKAALEIKDLGGIQRTGVKLLSQINSMKDKTETFMINIGMGGMSSLSDPITGPSSVKAQISFIEKDTLHIVFDKLLPKRPKSVKNYQTEKFENIKKTYIKPILDFMKDKRVFIYEEKAIVVFIHHFANEHTVRDHDNFEVKFIIDCLAAYTLIDDSAKYLSQYMDYVMDDKDYSEIYLMPYSKFYNFIEKK